MSPSLFGTPLSLSLSLSIIFVLFKCDLQSWVILSFQLRDSCQTTTVALLVLSLDLEQQHGPTHSSRVELIDRVGVVTF